MGTAFTPSPTRRFHAQVREGFTRHGLPEAGLRAFQDRLQIGGPLQIGGHTQRTRCGSPDLQTLPSALETLVRQRHRTASRQIEANVQSRMRIVYGAAALETGPGMFARMRHGVKEHVNMHLDMFAAAVGQCQASIQALVEAVTEEALRRVRAAGKWFATLYAQYLEARVSSPEHDAGLMLAIRWQDRFTEVKAKLGCPTQGGP